MQSARRILLGKDPFLDTKGGYWSGRGIWPASWVDHPERPLERPTVALFRLKVRLEEPVVVRLHVSADNRYRLYLDGAPVGCGPERGSPESWYFESYDLALEAGAHVLVAQTWWLGDSAPWAQMSIRPGFLCGAEAPWAKLFDTGVAPWEVMLAEGYAFPPIPKSVLAWHAVGNRLEVDGACYPWGFESGDCAGVWNLARTVAPAYVAGARDTARYWNLVPALLPPMFEQERTSGLLRHLDDMIGVEDRVLSSRHLAEEGASWQSMLAGRGPVRIPAHTKRRVLLDLDDYVCAYPLLRVRGGAGSSLRLEWAEALCIPPLDRIDPATQAALREKGNRDEIEGRCFVGIGDTFLPDGAERTFSTLWWEAGRYLCLTVQTGNQALEVESLRLRETRYPLAMEGTFSASDDRLSALVPLGLRAMQMCSHETYMDCPYYEQLMYIGDTRLEALVTHVLTGDASLPWKAVRTFAFSRRLNGFTRSAFPSHTVQVIPPFSLWWVNMAHDFWMWRDRDGRTRQVLPAVRNVMEGFHGLLRADGLLDAPPEWNFADWVPSWKGGIPPGAEHGPHALIHLQYVLALQAKAEMERGHGERELAERDERLAGQAFEALMAAFWSEQRGLLCDDPQARHWSEHVQCLALLTGLLPADRQKRVADGLFRAEDLARTTIYFSHYYFEACRTLGRMDKLFERLSLWESLVRLGFRTTVESPEPSRSDCHAWGAHPIFHYYATILGIRPQKPGFGRVQIEPQLGPLDWVEGTLPHPCGQIQLRVNRKGAGLQAQITLPEGLQGVICLNGNRYKLEPGQTTRE